MYLVGQAKYVGMVYKIFSESLKALAYVPPDY
jgi:hypothetical protein